MAAQSEFRAALLDPSAPVPTELRQPNGELAKERFGVYRNNVMSSLIDAMTVGFPVIHALLGEEYFRALGAEFARQHPPTSPVLAHYGAEFPSFLQGFEPLAGYPYLADVATLELCRRGSCNAVDVPLRAAEQLGAIDSELLMTVIPQPHASLRLMQSAWPVHEMWRANTSGEADDSANMQLGPQRVMTVRPALEVLQYAMDEDAYCFVAAIDGKKTLAAIAAQVLETYPDTDFVQLMVLMIQRGAIAEFTVPEEASP